MDPKVIKLPARPARPRPGSRVARDMASKRVLLLVCCGVTAALVAGCRTDSVLPTPETSPSGAPSASGIPSPTPAIPGLPQPAGGSADLGTIPPTSSSAAPTPAPFVASTPATPTTTALAPPGYNPQYNQNFNRPGFNRPDYNSPDYNRDYNRGYNPNYAPDYNNHDGY